MRKIIFITLALLSTAAMAQSEKRAKIEFEKTTIDLGKFGQENPIQKCYFIFKNTGNANLYIHQIMTSCSCTSNKYPKHAIVPGASDTIFVTYNGERKSPQKFRSGITIHSNATVEMTKVYIKGEMLPAKIQETPIIEIEE